MSDRYPIEQISKCQMLAADSYIQELYLGEPTFLCPRCNRRMPVSLICDLGKQAMSLEGRFMVRMYEIQIEIATIYAKTLPSRVDFYIAMHRKPITDPSRLLPRR